MNPETATALGQYILYAGDWIISAYLANRLTRERKGIIPTILAGVELIAGQYGLKYDWDPFYMGLIGVSLIGLSIGMAYGLGQRNRE